MFGTTVSTAHLLASVTLLSLPIHAWNIPRFLAKEAIAVEKEHRLESRQNTLDIISSACGSLTGSQYDSCSSTLQSAISASIASYCATKSSEYQVCATSVPGTSCQNALNAYNNCGSYALSIYNYCILTGSSTPTDAITCANRNLDVLRTAATTTFVNALGVVVVTTVPDPVPSLVCFEDNELRALERFNTDAVTFCPTFTANPGVALPTWLAGFATPSISSACTCFERTAAGGVGGGALPTAAPTTTTPPAVLPVASVAAPIVTNCFEDNELRALERFNTDAITFCQTFTATPGLALPTYLAGFLPQSISSACSCFERTAVGGVGGGALPTVAPTTTTPPAVLPVASVAAPIVTACFEDNELRALERFSTDAITFCPTFTNQASGVLPTYLAGFLPQSINSACSCFIRTAVPGAGLPTTTSTTTSTTSAGGGGGGGGLIGLPVPIPTLPVTSVVAVVTPTLIAAPVTSLTCFEDNELRALERFNTDAVTFCPTYTTAAGQALPTWLAGFQASAISSACTCFERTAVGGVVVPATTPTSTAGSGGGLLPGLPGLPITSAVGAVTSGLNPTPAASLTCFEDNELRALERFNTDAVTFCPRYTTAAGQPLPTWLAGFQASAISSACTCFERTAAAGVGVPAATPTSTAGSGGGLLPGLPGLPITSAVGAVTSGLNPTPAVSLTCFEDNELRALERFNTDAVTFCPRYTTAAGQPLPTWLAGFQASAISSACTCFERTAVGGVVVPTSTAGSGGLLPGLPGLPLTSVVGAVTSALPVVSPILPLPTLSSVISAAGSIVPVVSPVVSAVTSVAPVVGALICYEDNELRALERFSTDAINFCPAYLVSGGPLPTYLAGFSSPAISSACQCFERTAGILPTGIVPTNILPTNVLPTNVLPTSILPTNVLPTSILPTNVLPTNILPTSILPTNVLPTNILPTSILPTSILPTNILPTSILPTNILPTSILPTGLPLTSLLPTSLPLTSLLPTGLPTGLPLTSLLPTSLPLTSLLPTGLPLTSLLPTSLPLTSLLPTGLPLTSLLPTGLPSMSSLLNGGICYEDNELRALERFSTDAVNFCPGYLVSGGTLPTYLVGFTGPAVTSACSCFQKTATAGPTGVAPTGPVTSVPTTSSLLNGGICYEDNELRALERFSSDAVNFCPGYLVSGGILPTYLVGFSQPAVASACSCFQKTATGAATALPAGTSASSTSRGIVTSTAFVTQTFTFTSCSPGVVSCPATTIVSTSSSLSTFTTASTFPLSSATTTSGVSTTTSSGRSSTTTSVISSTTSSGRSSTTTSGISSTTSSAGSSTVTSSGSSTTTSSGSSATTSGSTYTTSSGGSSVTTSGTGSTTTSRGSSTTSGGSSTTTSGGSSTSRTGSTTTTGPSTTSSGFVTSATTSSGGNGSSSSGSSISSRSSTGSSTGSSSGTSVSSSASTTSFSTRTLYPTTKSVTTVTNGSTIVTAQTSQCVRKRRVRAVRV
ncbi:MAG: hypothetical protein M1816_002919 [Peltula sp. TS41687]|nr:MAG: hypothetical protein M1816_002919 [Peltula sp. TS41687]